MIGGDQAGALRDLVSRKKEQPSVPLSTCNTIAVTSGKGGVGKTNFSIFLAKALAARGERILLFDGDMGLANLHILLGVTAPHTIKDYLTGKCTLEEAVYNVEAGVDLLPGSSGSVGLANISPRDLAMFLSKLNMITSQYDHMIVDGGAGIAESSLGLTMSADSVVVVITPDPTSLADAYATIKVLVARGCSSFSVVVNMVESEEEGAAIEEKLSLLTQKFLGITPVFLGRIMRDRKLASVIREDRSVLSEKGLTDFTNRMNHISLQLIETENKDGEGFFGRFLTSVSGR